VVTFSRTLTLVEYRAANQLMLRNGTVSHRFVYWFTLRILPAVSVLMLAFLLYAAIYQNRAGEVSIAILISAGAFLYLLSQPLLLRLKLKRMHHAQRLDSTWTIEVSDDGIRSNLEGIADTKFNWAYFDKVVDGKDYFLFVNTRRPSFITFAKRKLSQPELAELRAFGGAHVTDPS
jgi:hypothetical protein